MIIVSKNYDNDNNNVKINRTIKIIAKITILKLTLRLLEITMIISSNCSYQKRFLQFIYVQVQFLTNSANVKRQTQPQTQSLTFSLYGVLLSQEYFSNNILFLKGLTGRFCQLM